MKNLRKYLFNQYNVDYSETQPLILKGISSITDSEAIEVAKIANVKLRHPINLYQGIKEGGGKALFYRYFNGSWYENDAILNIINASFEASNGINIYGTYNVQIYQYLQQQGFALPVYYQGVLYSVEKLTEFGFIKIGE